MKPVRILLAAAIAALSLNAHAVSVPTDGSRIEFDFNVPVSALYDLATFETSFAFTLSQSSILRVADLGFSSDRFNIFANRGRYHLHHPADDNPAAHPQTARRFARYHGYDQLRS